MFRALFLLNLVGPTQAGDLPPLPVVNGTTTREYEAVGAIAVSDGEYLYGPFCSGTLVHEYWVITAAHCVDALLQDYGRYDGYFILGYDFTSSSGLTDYAAIREAMSHPDYDERNLEADIGLLQLYSALRSTDPMPVNESSVNSSWYGKELRYVGFGVTRDNGNDSGVKRYADIPVADYDSVFIYGYDPEDGQNVCSGDSGGAALEMLGGSVFELAGVNSFVSPGCVDGWNGATRVDRYLDWITDYADVHGAGEGDTDTDSDADTDTDTDADADADGDADTDVHDGDTPERPKNADVDAWMTSCASVPAPRAGFLALALAGLALLGRRRS